MDCIFCKIVNRELPSHIVYEDDEHMAFLSIFPNTPGVTVVIPKKHYSSYAFDLPTEELNKLVQKSALVGKILDNAFDDVGRTAMVFEGLGVNHAHAKLFPLHGTKKSWETKENKNDVFFDKYIGHISTHDYKGDLIPNLEEMANKIRKSYLNK